MRSIRRTILGLIVHYFRRECCDCPYFGMDYCREALKDDTRALFRGRKGGERG